MRLDKLFWNSVMAGPLLGFAAPSFFRRVLHFVSGERSVDQASTLSRDTSDDVTHHMTRHRAPRATTLDAAETETSQNSCCDFERPGCVVAVTLGRRHHSCLLFQIGLILVVLTAADMYTSDVMFLPVAYLHRRVSLLDVVKLWVISLFGNLGGLLLFCLIICGYGGVFKSDVWKDESTKLASTQGCSALASGLPQSNRNELARLPRSLDGHLLPMSKIVSVWWPIMAFAGLGMDYVIANMFLIPIGILNRAPVGVGYYLWKSSIPALIGNTIGGVLFVGSVYWTSYTTGDESVPAKFDQPELLYLGAMTALDENAGPVHRSDNHGLSNGGAEVRSKAV